MRQRGVSLWHRLKRDGLLIDQTVFETTSVQKSAAGVPRWNFLVLSHLAPSITPETFFKAEGRRGGQRVGTTPSDAPGVETRRVEVLHSTPNSYYPSLASSDRDANAPEFIVPYIVEYIAVRDTSAALDQYRETMRSNIGPAVGQLIRDNWFVNLIALETVSVVYTQPTMPSWNQIHIRGYFPEKGATPAALDEALRRVNPQSGGYAGLFAPLDAIRTWALELKMSLAHYVSWQFDDEASDEYRVCAYLLRGLWAPNADEYRRPTYRCAERCSSARGT